MKKVQRLREAAVKAALAQFLLELDRISEHQLKNVTITLYAPMQHLSLPGTVHQTTLPNAVTVRYQEVQADVPVKHYVSIIDADA